MGKSGNGKQLIECALCGKSYKTNTWYEKHLKTHETTSHVTKAVGSDQSDNAASAVVQTSAQSAQQIPSSSSTSVHGDISVLASTSHDADVDSDAESAAAGEELAAQNMVWEEWSDEEEDQETRSYFVLNPWEDDENEELRRAYQLGLGNLDDEDEVIAQNGKKQCALVTCSQCGSHFRTIEGYVKHRVGHGMQAALIHVPSLEQVVENSCTSGLEVLSEMETTKLNAGFAPQVTALATALKEHLGSENMSIFFRKVCDGLYQFLQGKDSFVFPSTLAAAYLVNQSKFLVDVNLRDSLVAHLLNHVDASLEIINIFIAKFLLLFSQKVLSFILHKIGANREKEYLSLEERYATTKQSVVSLDFKQNMHYIGGSNVKSILKTALKFKHPNEEWERVIMTIKNHFLISELSTAPAPVLMAWTDSLDRGKLTKISLNALEFFVQLGKEVKPLEKLDGSLLTKDVFDKVSESGSILYRWAKLKGDLSEEESFKLLHALVCHFCVTWRTGIIGRRKDEWALQKNARKYGTGGLGFRATVGLSK